MKIIEITALIGALAASAASAETYSGGAIGRGTNANTMVPLSQSHIVMGIGGTYDSFEVAEGHPLEGASGPCFGAVEINAGQVSGGGRCVYQDAAGEQVVMVWEAMALSESGALTGEWTLSGGTGAWAEATGAGTFSSLTNPETGAFVNTITGDITRD